MNFNLIATLIAAVAFTFTAAVTDEQTGKGHKDTKLAAAYPVRGDKKHESVGKHRYSSVLEEASAKHESSKICTRKLEEIIYSPPSTVKDYLAKIADEIRADIQVIMAAFAGGNLEYIRTYVQRYNIVITLLGPFGQPVIVTSDFFAYTDYIKNVAIAQTYAGRDGFYVDTASGFYNYQFTLMSTNGQLISFVLSLPLSAMANVPTYCKK